MRWKKQEPCHLLALLGPWLGSKQRSRGLGGSAAIKRTIPADALTPDHASPCLSSQKVLTTPSTLLTFRHIGGAHLLRSARPFSSHARTPLDGLAFRLARVSGPNSAPSFMANSAPARRQRSVLAEQILDSSDPQSPRHRRGYSACMSVLVYVRGVAEVRTIAPPPRKILSFLRSPPRHRPPRACHPNSSSDMPVEARVSWPCDISREAAGRTAVPR